MNTPVTWTYEYQIYPEQLSQVSKELIFHSSLFLVLSGVQTIRAKAALIAFVFAKSGLHVLVKAGAESHQAGFYHK